jgi:hypothetical protein
MPSWSETDGLSVEEVLAWAVRRRGLWLCEGRAEDDIPDPRLAERCRVALHHRETQNLKSYYVSITCLLMCLAEFGQPYMMMRISLSTVAHSQSMTKDMQCWQKKVITRLAYVRVHGQNKNRTLFISDMFYSCYRAQS